MVGRSCSRRSKVVMAAGRWRAEGRAGLAGDALVPVVGRWVVGCEAVVTWGRLGGAREVVVGG